MTRNLEAQPVVRAWKALDCGHPGTAPAVPARVEILRRRTKSVVYRLPSVGRGGRDAIAKHCLRETAATERQVYLVLRDLPLSAPFYYGSAGDPHDEFGWLFLEDAGGEPFDPGDREHREMATRWLAVLHTATSRLDTASRLPDRGPGWYLEHLRSARRRILRNWTNPALAAADLEALHQVAGLLDTAESRWRDVESSCMEMPWALVHGDFAERNVRIRRCNGPDAAGPAPTGGPCAEPALPGASHAEAVLLAFDWEVAGWGVPAVDLACADLELYGSLVRDSWPHVGMATLRRLVHVGELMRSGIAAVSWEATRLETPWVASAMENMRIYRERMRRSLRALGWDAAPDAGGSVR